MRDRRTVLEWSVYAPLIVLFLLSAQLRVEGDTLTLIHGAASARQCLVEWTIPCTRWGVHFPIFQYLFAVPLLSAGLSQPEVAKALALLNLAFALATVGVFVRIGRAMAGVAGTHFALALLFSGYAIYYFFASFNEIAAFALFAALCAAVLLRDRPWIVFALAVLCSITKDIAPPFVLFVYLAARVAAGDRSFRRETWSGVLRSAWPVLAGAALGIAINSLFNVFRYYETWAKVEHLRPMLAAPPSAVTAYFWYLFASPAGGLVYAWLSLVLLALVLLFRARKDDGELAAVGLAIAIVVAANLGLAFWWSSFGWNSWGPRLTLPFLGAVGVLLVFLGRPLLQALRQSGTSWAIAVVFLVIFVSLLPNVLVIAAPGVFFGPMFAPGTMHTLVPDASIVQKSGPEIVKMVLLEAYGRIVVIPATLEAAAKQPLVVVLAAAYAALAAWRIFKSSSDRLLTPPEPGLEARPARTAGAWVLVLLFVVSSVLVYSLGPTPRADRPVAVSPPDKRPTFMRNAQGSERATFFPFTEPRVGTQVGTLAADGFRSTGAAGFLQWGPYATLLPGRYRAIWIGRLDRATSKPAGIVDVTSDAGQRSHAQAPLPSTPPAPGTLATLDFTLEKETPQMEFRLKVNEGTLATVERVELERR